MSITAAIKFAQPPIVGVAGQAFIGNLAGPVICSNGNDIGVATWQWTLLTVDRNSALLPGTLLGTTPSVSFLPDVSGSYRLELVVSDGALDVQTDVRVFSVPDTRGVIIPAFDGDADAHNYGGQKRGWAGPPKAFLAGDMLIDEFLADISDALSHLAGDVSGDSRSNTVNKIKGTPLGALGGAAVGDRLTWNGAAWVPSPVSGAGETAPNVFGIDGVYSGAVVPGTFDPPRYVDTARTIKNVRILRRTKGLAGQTRVDILKNGVSIFPAPANCPTVNVAGGDYATDVRNLFVLGADVLAPGDHLDAVLLSAETGPAEGLSVVVTFV